MQALSYRQRRPYNSLERAGGDPTRYKRIYREERRICPAQPLIMKS